ncbi:hypothetical protein J6590_065986 [Homalodisca vitripennis]|nr:hypothetical protein J6590_065986 [Homalodisca vitripennis]
MPLFASADYDRQPVTIAQAVHYAANRITQIKRRAAVLTRNLDLFDPEPKPEYISYRCRSSDSHPHTEHFACSHCAANRITQRKRRAAVLTRNLDLFDPEPKPEYISYRRRSSDSHPHTEHFACSHCAANRITQRKRRAAVLTRNLDLFAPEPKPEYISYRCRSSDSHPHTEHFACSHCAANRITQIKRAAPQC